MTETPTTTGTGTGTGTGTAQRGFTLVRVLAAPPETVFRAWTEPDHLGWFFNPDTVVDEPPTVDLRVGGVWRQRMRIDHETDYMTGGVYRQIVPGRRIAFTWGAEDGWPEIDPARPEDGILITVDLEPEGAGTRMTCTLALPAGITEAEAREWFGKGIERGLEQTMDRLVALYEEPAA